MEKEVFLARFEGWVDDPGFVFWEIHVCKEKWQRQIGNALEPSYSGICHVSLTITGIKFLYLHECFLQFNMLQKRHVSFLLT